MKIREYQDSDWKTLWPIIEEVFRAGETYTFSPEITEQDGYKAWVGSPQATYLTVGENGDILGTYFIKQNQPGLGSHVCNCGYIVSKTSLNTRV